MPVITFTGFLVAVTMLSIHDFTLYNLGSWKNTKIHLMSTTNFAALAEEEHPLLN